MFKISIVATIIISLITGIVTGIIASIIFYYMLKYIKPKLSISPYMCLISQSEDDPIYQVKFVNQSKKNITDLDYVLQHMIIGKDGVHTTKELLPYKEKLKFISKYDKSDKDANYAVRISYKIPKVYIPNDNTKLLFTVIAKDPDSGSTTCIIQEFKKTNLVCGKHQTKESLEYLAVSDTIPEKQPLSTLQN